MIPLLKSFRRSALRDDGASGGSSSPLVVAPLYAAKRGYDALGRPPRVVGCFAPGFTCTAVLSGRPQNQRNMPGCQLPVGGTGIHARPPG